MCEKKWEDVCKKVKTDSEKGEGRVERNWNLDSNDFGVDRPSPEVIRKHELLSAVGEETLTNLCVLAEKAHEVVAKFNDTVVESIAIQMLSKDEDEVNRVKPQSVAYLLSQARGAEKAYMNILDILRPCVAVQPDKEEK